MSDRQLVVTAKAAPLRQSLAPWAWVVLEELALGSDTVGVATTNSRRLAGELGMSKDTVSRAMQRLIAAGLVGRIERREDSSGRFGAIAYRVDLAAAGLVVQPVHGPTAEPIAETAGPSALLAAPPPANGVRRPTPRPNRRPLGAVPVGSDERSGRTVGAGEPTPHRPTTAPTTSRRRAARTAANDSSNGTDQLELFGTDTATRPDLANDRDS